jgi:hypothetical protein
MVLIKLSIHLQWIVLNKLKTQKGVKGACISYEIALCDPKAHVHLYYYA